MAAANTRSNLYPTVHGKENGTRTVKNDADKEARVDLLSGSTTEQTSESDSTDIPGHCSGVNKEHRHTHAHRQLGNVDIVQVGDDYRTTSSSDEDGYEGCNVSFSVEPAGSSSGRPAFLGSTKCADSLADITESGANCAMKSLVGNLDGPSVSLTLMSPRKGSGKRHRDKAEWKRNKAKRLRNSGLAYTSARGKFVPKKVIGPGCNEKCRFSCHFAFSKEERANLFSNFWSLGNVTPQRAFILRCVDRIETKRPRRKKTCEPGQGHQRKYTMEYHFFVKNNKIQVCKTFFLDTLGIKADTVFGAFRKMDGKSGSVTPELRGRHGHHRSADESRKELVRHHIKKFSSMATQEWTSDNQMQYLVPGLTMNKMYCMYRDWCSREGLTALKRSLYTEIFHTDFNYALHKARKDLECSNSLAENLQRPGYKEISSVSRKPSPSSPIRLCPSPKTPQEVSERLPLLATKEDKAQFNVLCEEQFSPENLPEEPSTSSSSGKCTKSVGKRNKNEAEWKRNKAKRLRNCGLEYTTARGKRVPQKVIGPGCDEKCRYSCHTAFSELERSSFFSDFWTLGDVTTQRQFILEYVDRIDTKRPRPKKPSQTGQCHDRKYTLEYHFLSKNGKIQVCKTFFLDTLGIKADTVFGAFRKMDGKSGTVTSELRGRHGHHKCVDESLKEAARQHIRILSAATTQESTNASDKQTLEPGLTLEKVYSMYLDWCAQENLTAVKKSLYNDIFHADFNLTFHKSRKAQSEPITTIGMALRPGEDVSSTVADLMIQRRLDTDSLMELPQQFTDNSTLPQWQA